MNRLTRVRRLEEQLLVGEALDRELERLWYEWCEVAPEEDILAMMQIKTPEEMREFFRQRERAADR